ncbi:hypothetical protein M218_23300 [Burkholderia pseudomallei MSHR338]|nr:hypothetical protein M218_23300 [Burkholderia pseudomallei MSHR338]
MPRSRVQIGRAEVVAAAVAPPRLPFACSETATQLRVVSHQMVL